MTANLTLPAGPSSKTISQAFKLDAAKVDFSRQDRPDESFEKNLSDASRSQSRESAERPDRSDRGDPKHKSDTDPVDKAAGDGGIDDDGKVEDSTDSAGQRDAHSDSDADAAADEESRNSSADDDVSARGEDSDGDEIEAQQSTDQSAIIDTAAQQLRLLVDSAAQGAAGGEQAVGQAHSEKAQSQSLANSNPHQAQQTPMSQVIAEAQAQAATAAGEQSGEGDQSGFGQSSQQAGAMMGLVSTEGDSTSSKSTNFEGTSSETQGIKADSSSTQANVAGGGVGQGAAGPQSGERIDNAQTAMQKLDQAQEQKQQDQANVSRVSRALQTVVNQRGGTVTLRLQPPDLGSLKIEMLVRDGVVSARFTAQGDSVRNLLLDQMGHLRHALDRQGLVIDKLEVQTDANSSNLGQSQDEAGNDGRSKDEYAMNRQSKGQQQAGESDDGDSGLTEFEQAVQELAT